MKRTCVFAAALAVLAGGSAALGELLPPPPTATDNVVDTIQGERVADPYRWLEDWNDPRVQAWSNAQNTRTRAYLDVLPDRGTVKVHTRVLNQDGVLVAEFKRVVLVPRRNPGAVAPA